MKALRNAIYAKCAGSSLDTLINGQIFYGTVPQGVRFPFVVFYFIGDNRDKTFTEKFGDSQVQFSVFSAIQSSSNEAYDITAAIESLYDECSLSITGATLLRMNLANIVGPDTDETISQDGSESGWACHIDFDVLIQIP